MPIELPAGMFDDYVLFYAAQQWALKGVSVIPVNADKSPCLQAIRAAVGDKDATHDVFRQRLSTEDELFAMTTHPATKGIGVICGPTRDERGNVTGYLHCFDFDLDTMFERWEEPARTPSADLYMESSIKGIHQFWWLPAQYPSPKLAMYRNPDPTAKAQWLTGIELLSNGRYCVVAPSYGVYAPLHTATHVASLKLQRSCQVFEEAMAAARKLDERTTQDRREQQRQREAAPRAPYAGDSPIEAFRLRYSVADMLRRCDYQEVTPGRWKHPSEQNGTSVTVKSYSFATSDPCGSERSYHHSSNDPLSDGKPHDAWDIFVHWGFNGDEQAALQAACKEFEITMTAPTTDTAPAPSSAPEDAPRPRSRASKLLTFGDIKKLPPPDPVPYTRDMLVRNSVALVYGPTHVGKSFFVLDELCLPLSLYGCEDIVYVAPEGGGGYAKRTAAWLEVRQADDPGRIRWYPYPVNLRDAGSVAAFCDEIHGVGFKPTLVVLDTLSLCLGGANENEASAMNDAIAAAVSLRRQLRAGVTVLLVHHANGAGTGPRGNTALPGGVDTIIRLDDIDGLTRVVCEKQKDQPKFETWHFELLPAGESMVVSRCNPLARTGTTLTENQMKILALLGMQSMKHGERFSAIQPTMNCSQSTTYSALERLMKLDLIEQDASRIYKITAAGREQLHYPPDLYPVAEDNGWDEPEPVPVITPRRRASR